MSYCSFPQDILFRGSGFGLRFPKREVRIGSPIFAPQFPSLFLPRIARFAKEAEAI